MQQRRARSGTRVPQGRRAGSGRSYRANLSLDRQSRSSIRALRRYRTRCAERSRVRRGRRNLVHGYWGKSGLFYCQPDGSSINVGFSAAVNGRGFGAISYNGVGLSPDGKAVYVADTRSTRVIGFTLADHGKLAPGTGVRGAPDKTLATVPGDLGLDSLAVP